MPGLLASRQDLFLDNPSNLGANTLYGSHQSVQRSTKRESPTP